MLFYSIYIFLVIKEYFSHVCKGVLQENLQNCIVLFLMLREKINTI